MNERIFDLAVKHKHIVGELPLNIVEELKLVELERFAEAIIQECIDCAVWVGHTNHNSIEPIYTVHAVKKRIKQHFGVEE